jgi:hypothetical protein
VQKCYTYELVPECLHFCLPHPCVTYGQVQPVGIELKGGGGHVLHKKLQEITAICDHNLVLALNKQDCGDIQECF